MNREPYIIVLRKLFHDDLWTSEQFTKGQAWVDLFFWAYHSDGNFKWNGKRYNLRRGQFCHTEEYLCKRWRWSRNKLRRTFKKWQENGMITIQRLAQQTAQRTAQPRNVITLCNYDKIQFSSKGNGTTHGTTNGTTHGQQTAHNNNKRKEIIIRKNLNKPSRKISEKDIRRSQKTKQALDKLLALHQESSV